MPSNYPALIPRRHGEDAIANMRDVRQTIAANKNGDRISKKLDQTWPSIYKRVFPAPLRFLKQFIYGASPRRGAWLRLNTSGTSFTKLH